MGRVVDGRPDAYDDNSGLAPIAGGLNANVSDPLSAQPGSFGPVVNGNVVTFGVGASFSIPLAASNGATMIYAVGQEMTCQQFIGQGKSSVASLVQIALPRSVPIGTYEVTLADATSAALAPPDGQAYVSLIANGVPLLQKAKGSLVVTASSSGTIEVQRLSVVFAGGQTMAIDSIEAAPCSQATAGGTFSVASAYVRPATGATSLVAAEGPVISLHDRAITCAALRDPTTIMPQEGNVLYIVLPAATAGTYSLINSNAASGDLVGGTNASLRYSQPATALISTGGTATLSSVQGNFQGTVQAALNDGTTLPQIGFSATPCP